MVCKDVGSVLARKEELACAVSRKLKAGSTVSTFVFPPEFLRQVRELAVRWGKNAGERAVEEIGTNPQMDFIAIEQFAAVVAAGVTEGTVASLLDKQAQTLANEHPCPKCGTCCQVNFHDRPITLETGQVIQLHEPICHCPTCRGDFFPPTHFSTSG
jgi:Zn finger protein HypA/HybF involved in hydrogenase expression